PVANAVQNQRNGANEDVFVTKLSGSSLAFSTYLGGSGADIPYAGVGIDAEGFIFVAGQTSSVDFPLVNPLQSAPAGGSDLFVTRFTAEGQLAYSTYLGGTLSDGTRDMLVTPEGRVYLAIYAADFPILNPLPGSPWVLGNIQAVVAV